MSEFMKHLKGAQAVTFWEPLTETTDKLQVTGGKEKS
jgi:hypothetical protein